MSSQSNDVNSSISGLLIPTFEVIAREAVEASIIDQVWLDDLRHLDNDSQG